jgi:hypothetical protein
MNCAYARTRCIEHALTSRTARYANNNTTVHNARYESHTATNLETVATVTELLAEDRSLLDSFLGILHL